MKITFHTQQGDDLGEGTTSGPVPRAGDMFMNGSTEYDVATVTWQLDGHELECYVTVKPPQTTTPMATYA